MTGNESAGDRDFTSSASLPIFQVLRCRDLLLAVCKENKQKRQRACGQMPTHRLKAPNVKRGLKHGWGPAWFDQFHYNSWTEKRMGPAY